MNRYETIIIEISIILFLGGIGWLGFVPCLLLTGNFGFNVLKLSTEPLKIFMIVMSLCYIFFVAGLCFWLCKKMVAFGREEARR